MFEGRVLDEGSGSLRIQSEELGCVVAVDRSVNCGRGATVWTAVRPEKINISRDPQQGSPENVVRGTVKEIAYMGDVSIYHVQIDSGKIVRVTLPNIMRDAEHRITRDETVYLSWHGSSPVVLTE
jgi:putrescine transport system ATP-binding protein